MSVSFRSRNKNKINEKKETENEEKDNESKYLSINEEESSSEDEEEKSNSSNANDDVESISESIDEERLTLGQINKLASKKKKKDENKGLKSLFLKHKRKSEDHTAIIYDETKGEILNTFYGSVEELNEFLIHCQIQKISYDSLSNSSLNQSNSISFDPNEWMKSNKIEQRTLSYEELSVYCHDRINKKNKNIKKIKQEREIKKEEENINEKKENLKKIEPDFKNPKLRENYIKLQNIISSETLSLEQKLWLNVFLDEINKINIDDINIEKDYEGKDNKLEVVFDLDNTCIFSFLSSSDILTVQNKRNILPQKEVKMFSFKYNNKVIYTVLIIRKGLKEFIQYIKRLCNFHISTLGAENYGNEIKDILSEYSGVQFIRYKGRLYDEENIKNISDLYIVKDKTVIFDDNIKVWENKKRDNEHVINSKFFFDEECAMLNINTADNNMNNNYSDRFCSEIDLFIKSYRAFYYNRIKPESNENDIDWKNQQIIEYATVPFYQFKPFNDNNYNKCFTAEYLNSTKLQFIYMKNVIKQIYCLKFIYLIDIPLAIKMIRISTLADMTFDLKYLAYDQRNILTDMVRICGGMIYEKEYRKNDKKIYLVTSKRLYEFKSRNDEIQKDLSTNPFYVLINERFILDTYYFMTNLKDNINDPEYTFNESE
jgi:hypothetical protein